MKAYYIVGMIAVLLLLYPEIRILIKRIRLYCKLKHTCRKIDAKVIGTHLFWPLGSKNGGNSDFYIETPDKIYSVKLFAVRKRLSSLILTDQGQYRIRTTYALLGSITYHRDSGYQKLMAYQFRKAFREAWYIKEFVPVLLIHPVCREVLYQAEGDRPVNRGESINGMAIYTSSELIQKLRKDDYERTATDPY